MMGSEVLCNQGSGCTYKQVHEERHHGLEGRVDTLEKRVDDAEKETKSEHDRIHARITAIIMDKVIEYRWAIGIVVLQLIAIAMSVISMLVRK